MIVLDHLRRSCRMDVDVIPLRIPSDKDHQVSVSGLWWDGTQEDLELERDDEEQKDSVRYICLVRVRMPKEGLCSEGLGLGEAPCTTQSPQGRGQSVACARRFAINSAMKAAFGKFVIIKLRNGKVTVEVDTTQTDLQMYDPLWDSTEVEVNDIDHDPEEEDSDEEFAMLQDIDDEELGALLDITISKDA
ncbi:RAD52 motif-containing protein 1-like isoform X3 [Portunus trituberculatus]|uniref:RAD52 motif-containing protein 1-like isoform X3 n=1 Tax=Portunus trituberculatus TaxID=210409 RepID=UPI001E1CD8E2|nr:RAD52 motif-containing protein 1-like isoform X3 [Portunus trituberculatus]